ncbi:hypothetical protein OUZ56_008749 [Daphnia magna]|uniref:Uncharacterized protein n=1 Tax=Daphnia magna TaxID=35525 RepID=A0ABR0ADX6_9CRUS|nr:hypothetical protein OUZ56_008749 [Daphnia magna]
MSGQASGSLESFRSYRLYPAAIADYTPWRVRARQSCGAVAAFDWVVAERLIHHVDPFPFIIVNWAKKQRTETGWSACFTILRLINRSSQTRERLHMSSLIN